ncbi:MAG: hypothetical protein ACFFD4_00850 [Candidatus Odinarchaeota archaeon]
MSKSTCSNCNTVIFDDSSYCPNCGMEIITGKTPKGTRTSDSSANTLARREDYEWLKKVFMVFLAIPILCIGGLGITAIALTSSDIGYAAASSIEAVIIALGLVAIVSTIIAYSVFKKLAEH